MQALLSALNPKIRTQSSIKSDNVKRGTTFNQKSIDFNAEEGASKRNKLVRFKLKYKTHNAFIIFANYHLSFDV